MSKISREVIQTVKGLGITKSFLAEYINRAFGYVLVSNPTADGLDLNVMAMGTPEECLTGLVSPRRKAFILQVRSKTLAQYQSATDPKQKAFLLLLLKSFSNNVIPLHCRNGIVPAILK